MIALETKKKSARSVRRPVKTKSAVSPVKRSDAKPSVVRAKGKSAGAAGPPPPDAEAEIKKKPVTRNMAKYKVGQMVVYPFHGVGVVSSITKIDVTGDTVWYYTLNFRGGELTVMIPVEQQDQRGMRRVVGKSEVPKILALLKKRPNSEESDWKVRYNLYLEKLKSGDIYETAKVARNLTKRGPEGELSMSEKRLLEASMQLLVHEIAAASHQPIESVESEVNRLLKGRRAV